MGDRDDQLSFDPLLCGTEVVLSVKVSQNLRHLPCTQGAIFVTRQRFAEYLANIMDNIMQTKVTLVLVTHEHHWQLLSQI